MQEFEEHKRGGNLLWAPPIPFYPKEPKSHKKKSNKDDSDSEDEDDKTKYCTISLKLDPDKPLDEEGNKVTHKIPIFESGTPEEYCKWRENVDEVFDRKDLENAREMGNHFKSFLRGKAREDFKTSMAHSKEYNRNMEQTSFKLSPKAIMARALNSVAIRIFSTAEFSAAIQRRYLRQRIPFGDTNVVTYVDRLCKINNWFSYFPVETDKIYRGEEQEFPQPLPEDELMDILHYSQPVEWQVRSLQQGSFGFYDDIKEMASAFRRYQVADELEDRANALVKSTKESHSNGNKQNGNGNNKHNKNKNKSQHNKRNNNKRKRGRNRDDDSTDSNGNKPYQNKKKTARCKTCGNFHPGKCRFEKGNGNGNNDNKKDDSKSNDKTKKTVSIDESHVVVKKSLLKRLTQKASRRNNKRLVIDDSSDEEINLTTIDSDDEGSESNYMARLKEASSCKDNNSEVEPYSLYPFSTATPNSNQKPSKGNYTAEIIVEVTDCQGNRVPVNALLDTGTTSTIVLKDFVRKGAAGTEKGKKQEWNTLGGKFFTTKKALLDIRFPELDTTKVVTWIAHVDETTDKTEASYGMIIGMDMMTEIGIFVNTATKTIDWNETSTPLKQRGQLKESYYLNMCYHQALEPEVLKDAESRQKRILDADYSHVDMQTYVEELTHLSGDEKHKLKKVLQSHPTLFGGGLGTLKIKPVSLEIQDGAKPYHGRAYPIPHAYEEATKKEIARLCSIGVLEKNHDSEWAAASFVQPKKTGDVRVLTDFRKLNVVLKRQPFPLPKISDLLLKLKGFRYATALDLSMGYYHIPLDKAAQRLCTTVLPWGKYRYLRLPMGISSAPDIFQAIMTEMLGDFDFCRVYIDDILIISNGTYEDHMEKLNQVLQRLEERGFRANVRKCFFARDSLEYLGYWLTRNGIQPQPKKVEAICRLSAPQNRRQLRHFLGMVNYYRDMWQRRSHLIAPLSALTSKTVPWKWEAEQQEAFEKIKDVISKETLLAFPRFDIPFHVYTDASNKQLGAVIMQEGKPLAFYSRKLNHAQKKYTTGEQELLSIVETLKEFRNILLGQKVIVHTNHKNILYGNLSSDRIIRWRLLLEEFGPEYHYVKGDTNVVADALSRLDGPVEGADLAHCMCTLIRD